MQHLILIGLPGSGKGTQAKKLQDLGYDHISTGDLLRAEIQSGSDLGKEISALINQGKYISDDLALELIKKNIKQRPVILDGYPRTLAQAQLLLGVISNYKVIYLEVEESKIHDRLVNRRSCDKCGAIYNLLTQAPKKDGQCDLCLGNLSQRKDDVSEVVANRLSVYKQTVTPVIEMFKSRGELTVISGDQEPDTLFAEILKNLKSVSP